MVIYAIETTNEIFLNKRLAGHTSSSMSPVLNISSSSCKLELWLVTAEQKYCCIADMAIPLGKVKVLLKDRGLHTMFSS